MGADRAGFGSSDDIAERGHDAGRALGQDPIQSVNEIAQRVTALVDSLPDDHPMRTPAGKRPLASYLPSRVTELTIHTIDLSKAIGIPADAPPECLRLSLYGLADINEARGELRRREVRGGPYRVATSVNAS